MPQVIQEAKSTKDASCFREFFTVETLAAVGKSSHILSVGAIQLTVLSFGNSM